MWDFLDKDNGIYVYDSKFNLVFADKVGMKRRGLKEKSFGENIDKIFGDSNELRKILNDMRNKVAQDEIQMRLTDIRGVLHNDVSSFYGLYFKKKRFVVEVIQENRSVIEVFGIKEKNSGRRELFDFDDIITCNQEMLRVKRRAYESSRSSSNVLIYGETGTGKELMVQAIHKNSSRADRPFIAQNCSAIPKGLMESTLFGSEKGSYTGAVKSMGIFELANKGTLYLDELNSMPLEAQAKLLRVIQEKKLRRVGATKEIEIDVRVIASINETFEEVLQKGKIRSDLFFRLNVISLEIPPLRDRKEDVKRLIEHYIEYFNSRFGKSIQGIEEDCLKRLMDYEWNGNIRELKNLVEGIFNEKDLGTITLEDIKGRAAFGETDYSLSEKVEEYEKKLIMQALKCNNDNISRTAKYLSIPRQTLQSKMKKYFQED